MLTEGGERDGVGGDGGNEVQRGGVGGDGGEAEAMRNSRGELGEEAEERESGHAGVLVKIALTVAWGGKRAAAKICSSSAVSRRALLLYLARRERCGNYSSSALCSCRATAKQVTIASF